MVEKVGSDFLANHKNVVLSAKQRKPKQLRNYFRFVGVACGVLGERTREGAATKPPAKQAGRTAVRVTKFLIPANSTVS